MNYDVLQYINGHSVVCSFMENSIGLKSKNDFLMRCVKCGERLASNCILWPDCSLHWQGFSFLSEVW